MNKRPAFTLLEIMIALAIASLIFVVLVRTLKQSMISLRYGGETSEVARTVSLFFNQFEKDLTSAYVPYIYVEAKQKTPQRLSFEQKKLDDVFIAKFKEDIDAEKIGDQRLELVDSLNFVSTNPLQSYGRTKPRFARVKYSLEKIKDKKDVDVYNIWRSETLNLQNVNLKDPEEGVRTKEIDKIYKYKVAEKIKGLYLEFGHIKKTDGGEAEFSYVKEWENKNKLPKAVKVHLRLWSNNWKKELKFEKVIIFMTSPWKPKKEVNSESKKEEKKDEKPKK